MTPLSPFEIVRLAAACRTGQQWAMDVWKRAEEADDEAALVGPWKGTDAEADSVAVSPELPFGAGNLASEVNESARTTWRYLQAIASEQGG